MSSSQPSDLDRFRESLSAHFRTQERKYKNYARQAHDKSEQERFEAIADTYRLAAQDTQSLTLAGETRVLSLRREE